MMVFPALESDGLNGSGFPATDDDDPLKNTF
jgi:hypothetical protein